MISSLTDTKKNSGRLPALRVSNITFPCSFLPLVLLPGAYLLKVNVSLGLLVLFLATLFSGMPVSFAMGLFGIVGLYIFTGSYKMLMNAPGNGIQRYELSGGHRLSPLFSFRYNLKRR